MNGPELFKELALFLTVGVIASMDVVGLTISKLPEFRADVSRIRSWALSNALWHAGLLLVYIVFISSLFDFFFVEWMSVLMGIIQKFGDWLAWFPALRQSLGLIREAIVEHSRFILGLVALVIVWKTYSEKIVSEPETAFVRRLPPLARTVFNILELLVFASRNPRYSRTRTIGFLQTQAQAALVAVDMLALAVLLNGLHLLKAIYDSKQQTFSTEGLVSAMLCVICVFVAVYATTFLVAKHATKSFEQAARSASSRDWIRVTLRIGEPLLIFFFVLQLVAWLIFGKRVQSVSLLFGAGLLVLALVHRHSLQKVVQRALSQKRPHEGQNDEARSGASIWADLKSGMLTLLIWFAAFTALALAVALSILFRNHAFSPDMLPDKISLDEELGYTIMVVEWASIVLLFFPNLCLRCEVTILETFAWLRQNNVTIIYTMLALIIAAIFPIAEDLIDTVWSTRSTSIGQLFSDGHKHALQIGLYLGYLFAMGWIIRRFDININHEMPSRASSSTRKIITSIQNRLGVKVTLIVGGALLGAVSWLQGRVLNHLG